ncbi:unconventional myosin-XIX [Boleophthalmus pectinirostris]|uniref:unconventional myosin-XIX n=1 Tax=Boleophthalmus pectinirostris TaxID=150288 RepID=UPI002430636D|nr:unconventional myosin-XIX [Boleophthalmus pectinirostris]
MSVFSLLNEESRLNRASDAQMFRVRLENELSENGSISWDRFSKEPHFTVAHYAGKVNYQIQGMVEKNKDPVPPELIDMLQKSNNSLLHQIFAEVEDEQQTSKGLSKVTVVSKFKNSLESLMRILHSTTPHYTRCIKPNQDCKPLTFKKEEVIMQLEACGIVETIHISAAGFPVRIPFESFTQRYSLLLKHSKLKPAQTLDLAGGNLKEDVERLLHVILDQDGLLHQLRGDKQTTLVHCGKTKVFLTQSMLDFLEERRRRVLSQCAFTVQCCWLRYQRRKRITRQQSATLIQAVVRSWLVRRRVVQWNRAAAIIQRTWRKWRDLLKSLADLELDDAADVVTEELLELNPLIRERGSVHLSSISEPVTVRGWPMGLALASASSITVSFTATGFHKMVSLVASLKLPSRRGQYMVETNQCSEGLASIRAQPKGSTKLHYQRSPLLYADRHPDLQTHMTGFNEILLEKTL